MMEATIEDTSGREGTRDDSGDRSHDRKGRHDRGVTREVIREKIEAEDVSRI